MRPWRSIEFRLAAWYSLLLLGGLASLGGGLWWGVNYSLVAAVDDLLSARLSHLAAFIEAKFGDESEGEGHPAGPPRERVWLELQEDLSEYAASVPEGRWIHVRTGAGRILLPAPADPAEPAPVPWQEQPTPQATFWTIATRKDRYRVLGRQVQLESGLYRMQAASSLAAVRATQERLISWLLWAVPAGLALSFCGGYVISRAALRPVEKVVNVAGLMDVHRLSARLEVPATGDVVQRLAREIGAWRALAQGARLKPDSEGTAAMSKEELERLRALGYIQ